MVALGLYLGMLPFYERGLFSVNYVVAVRKKCDSINYFSLIRQQT